MSGLKFNVYDRQNLIFTDQLTQTVELGRQRDEQEQVLEQVLRQAVVLRSAAVDRARARFTAQQS